MKSIYGSLWSKLPGTWWVKSIIAITVILLIFILLIFVVFPRLDPVVPGNEVNVGLTGHSMLNDYNSDSSANIMVTAT